MDKKDVNVGNMNMKSGQSNENLIAFSLRMQGKLLNDVTKLKLCAKHKKKSLETVISTLFFLMRQLNSYFVLIFVSFFKL